MADWNRPESGAAGGGDMVALVEYMARALVDDPDQVEVTRAAERGSTVVLELRVAPDDMGRVIGKGGRVANAMRALVRVVAAREGRRAQLEIG
jgi:predicted RNA-binding protein YlqC (UPF0109 family)